MGDMDMGSGSTSMMDASSRDPLYLLLFSVLFIGVLAILWLTYRMTKDE
jgi:hypothetical protein